MEIPQVVLQKNDFDQAQNQNYFYILFGPKELVFKEVQTESVEFSSKNSFVSEVVLQRTVFSLFPGKNMSVIK